MIADPGLPAPVRFLPHTTTSSCPTTTGRGSTADDWGLDFAWKGAILVDGFIAGAWRVRREGGGKARGGRTATNVVTLYAPVTGAQRAEIEEEAERVLAFVAGDAESRRVELVDAG